MILQWGRAIEAASINFPIPFPTACLCLQANKLAETGAGIGSVENGTPTVVSVNSASSFGMSWGSLTGNSMYFFAIGY
ncbi:gp53-like domain-containing protein [Kluyvera ascorbata]